MNQIKESKQEDIALTFNRDPLSYSIPKVELSQISRTNRQEMIKICKNLRQGAT